jgi:trans-aconitate methyltransferase
MSPTEPAVVADSFEGQTCSAPEARTRRMADAVLQHVDAAQPLRILDLGCGTGQLAFRLRDALPCADITGLDISAANIDAANTARAARADQQALHFIQADYLTFERDPFDLVVTDGVLHLIAVDDTRLVRKLATDTRAGGLLVVCMPYACTFNSAFAITRRVLRVMRRPVLDRAITAAGRLLHPEASDAMLRERIHYIYRPPERVMGPALESAFAASGFQQHAAHAMPSSSLAQLRHSVTVWRKAQARS